MRPAPLLLALALCGCGPVPDAPPPGTRFFFLGPENTALTRGLRLVHDRELRGRVLTFDRAEGSRLVFRVEGDSREVRARELPAELVPVLEDRRVEALGRGLAGRRMWMYGGMIGGEDGTRVQNV